MNISIAITTHNRYEVFKETYKNIKKHLPEGAKLIVVDDGSCVPVKEADFRFDNAQGIAVAKNKCLELMGDADYYFCFDDDIYPKVKDWHLPYIDSGLNHLCFSFDKFSNGVSNARIKLRESKGIITWHEPCGLMLFFTRQCLESVGGFDPAYGKWGYEHVGWSMRVHNAGLTPSPFMDVSKSLDLFYSYDWDQSAKRSVTDRERAVCISPNRAKYQSEIKSSHFIPYKPLNSCVITTYFTGVVDPQRGTRYEAEYNILTPLLNSVKKFNSRAVVLNDCFAYFHSRSAKFIRVVNPAINPYFQRWFSIYDYLIKHPQIEQVFCVDATDVEMQLNPFMEMQKGYLYVGDESGNKINNIWLKKNHTFQGSDFFYNKYSGKPLLNAGIVGGFRDDVLNFCKQMMALYIATGGGHQQLTDMAAMNVVCHEIIGYDKIKHGPRINTRFKANERNTTSYFKHK